MKPMNQTLEKLLAPAKKQQVSEAVQGLLSSTVRKKIITLQFCQQQGSVVIQSCGCGPSIEIPGERVCVDIQREVDHDSTLVEGTVIGRFEVGDRLWNGQGWEIYEG